MIGPTGVGKTEIARRLAKLTDAPFVKTEATKFTEVGYVGRNVESIVRDLMQAGIKLVEAQQKKRVMTRAREQAEERVLDLLCLRPLPLRARRLRCRSKVPLAVVSAKTCALAAWMTRP